MPPGCYPPASGGRGGARCRALSDSAFRPDGTKSTPVRGRPNLEWSVSVPQLTGGEERRRSQNATNRDHCVDAGDERGRGRLCAATPTTGALATPWGVGGIHSFKPEPTPAEPNAAKVDKQVAQLLDDASQADQGPRRPRGRFKVTALLYLRAPSRASIRDRSSGLI